MERGESDMERGESDIGLIIESNEFNTTFIVVALRSY
jgi:hypothetical protein